MPRCERCGYLGAAKKWCARCASIDPSPSRRWMIRGVILFVFVLGVAAVLVVPRTLAKQAASEAMAKAKSFTVPREAKPAPTR